MTVKRRLSQTLGQIKKGYAVDTYEGGFPVVQCFGAVEELSATKVLASTALTSSVQTKTSLTNPDVYRNLSVKGNQASVLGNVVITGKDWADETITETIVASGTGIITGNKPFKSVDSLTLPALVSAGDEISVGQDDKLGLYRPLDAASDFVDMENRGSGATDDYATVARTVNTTYNTALPTGGVTDGEAYRLSYNTTIF